MERLFHWFIWLNVDGTIQSILDLASSVGMIYVSSIMRCCPCIEELIAGSYRFLWQSWYTIGPRCISLLNTWSQKLTRDFQRIKRTLPWKWTVASNGIELLTRNSTVSPCFNRRVGLGNCPLLRIVFRVAPATSWFSHVRLSSNWTTLQDTHWTRHKRYSRPSQLW